MDKNLSIRAAVFVQNKQGANYDGNTNNHAL